MARKIDGSRTLIEEGLVERLASRMQPFIAKESENANAGMRRERIVSYALDAVRETILNALVHRDWTKPSEVEVVIYSDR